MMINNVFFMQLAYKRAQISFLNNDVPVGCVITNKKNDTYYGNNIDSCNKTILGHAEMYTLSKIDNSIINLNDYIAITTLVPCPMCTGALYIKNIKRCVYGTLSNNQLHNKNFYMLFGKNKVESYLKKRCSKILNSFFKTKR